MDRSVYDNMARVDATHWWFVARRKIIAALISRHVRPGPGARILEVGCGTGSNLETLSRFGAVEAVEPDDAARALATLRSGIAVKAGGLPGVILEDGRYDVITLFDVLEHLPDDEGALALLRTKLTARGRLIVTVPAMPWLWSAHDLAHHHQRRYTRRSLTDLLARCGFEIRYVTHFNALLMPLVVAARALGRLIGRETGDDALPSPPINRTLEAIFATERHIAPFLPLPVGVSLAVIAGRAGDEAGLEIAA